MLGAWLQALGAPGQLQQLALACRAPETARTDRETAGAAPDRPAQRLPAAMAPAGEAEAPQDVRNGPAAPAEQQQQQAKPVKRYRRAELDEEEHNLLAEDGEDE